MANKIKPRLSYFKRKYWLLFPQSMKPLAL